MNARIEKLLEEAGGLSVGDDGERLAPMLVGESVQYYTQLVIEACAQLCDSRANVLTEYLTEHRENMHESAFNFVNGSIAASLRNASNIRKLKSDQPVEDID